MRKFLKVCKINILSIISLVLLCLSFLGKLLELIANKLKVLFAILCAFLPIYIIHDILSDESVALTLLFCLVIFFLLFAIVICFFHIIWEVIKALILMIFEITEILSETIYCIFFEGYVNLRDICEDDYTEICLSGNKILNGFECLFFSLEKGIVCTFRFIFKYLIWISIIISVLIAIGCIDLIRVKYSKLPALDMLYESLSNIMLWGAIVYFLISFTNDLREWIVGLHANNLSDKIESVNADDLTINHYSDNTAKYENDKIYHDMYLNYISDIDKISERILAVNEKKPNVALENTFSMYFSELYEIYELFKKHNLQLTAEQFHELIPKIQHIERLRNKLISSLEIIESEYSNAANYSIYFSGCNDLNSLDKRYKVLCKAYHPDSDSGDADSFMRMQSEYEKIKASMTPSEP